MNGNYYGSGYPSSHSGMQGGYPGSAMSMQSCGGMPQGTNFMPVMFPQNMNMFGYGMRGGMGGGFGGPPMSYPVPPAGPYGMGSKMCGGMSMGGQQGFQQSVGGGQLSRQGSMMGGLSGQGSMGSYGNFSGYRSFRDNPSEGCGNGLSNHGFGSMRLGSGSFASNPGSLHRMSSALDFNYPYGGNSFASSNGGCGGPAEGSQMMRQLSMGSAGFGSFRNGMTGVGPSMSMGSIGGAALGSEGSLPRQDSMQSLQRSYSIAGQFDAFGDSTMSGRYPSLTGNAVSATLSHTRLMHNRLGGPGPTQQSPFGMRGGMMPRSGEQPPMPMHHQGAPMQPIPDSGTVEGQPQPLGRKNSVGNLTRKESQKRVGMYFKNKAATDAEGNMQYKKEGDPGTGGNNARSKDPSLVNTVKAVFLLEKTGGDLEVDGKTVRCTKPGMDEVQKYDLSDIVYVNKNTDLDIRGDFLDTIRDNFVYGCNVGMLLSDADCPAHDPRGWFSWNSLRHVVKETFARIDHTCEFTLSICLLQDDQVMDLLADTPALTTLVVVESPLFGNVPNGMTYVCIDSAAEFNDTLDGALGKIVGRPGEERGIVLATCVLKQVKSSASTGNKDVIVSSIFASGVGSGIIHYSRILDKNPAEPRALFYSVLHRAVHSSAIFYCTESHPELFTYLTTLQRFSRVETRRPKVGSVRAFVAYAKSTIPKVKEDLEKIPEGKQKVMMLRYLEKLELMCADAEAMLANPADCVPKTYI